MGCSCFDGRHAFVAVAGHGHVLAPSRSIPAGIATLRIGDTVSLTIATDSQQRVVGLDVEVQR